MTRGATIFQFTDIAGRILCVPDSIKQKEEVLYNSLEARYRVVRNSACNQQRFIDPRQHPALQNTNLLTVRLSLHAISLLFQGLIDLLSDLCSERTVPLIDKPLLEELNKRTPNLERNVPERILRAIL